MLAPNAIHTGYLFVLVIDDQRRMVGEALGLVDAGLDSARRDPRRIEHQVRTLVGQRVFGLALGYEDLNDHETLRKDMALQTAAQGWVFR